MKTNNIKFTRALNRRLKWYRGNITPEKISGFSMAHDGICYKNSNLDPANAEKHQGAMVARELLVDSIGGQYEVITRPSLPV